MNQTPAIPWPLTIAAPEPAGIPGLKAVVNPFYTRHGRSVNIFCVMVFSALFFRCLKLTTIYDRFLRQSPNSI